MNTTLITGGTGKTGRRIAARLTERGITVRLGSRAGRPPFDWHDRTTWEPALADVSAVYLAYAPDVSAPGAAGTLDAFARLAVARGARRLVLLSGRGMPSAVPAEDAVRGAGAESWTVLRASWFAQNFSEDFLLDGVRQGEFILPAAEGVTEPFVDADDIADVAVEALTGPLPAHAGATYELSSPRLLTFEEAAGELSAAAGREIRYRRADPRSYRTLLTEAGLPPAEAEFTAGLFTDVLDGRNARVTDGVRAALGRAPRDFTDYLKEAAATGVWQG
ncbi:NmrA family transcriptional regulator [Streptomyces xiamenensis]|uniref:NmrA family transcriptional regulator n=1 Tax=Streptomyces xiamenensis TaxID=408015 RepID=UPI0036E65BED